MDNMNSTVSTFTPDNLIVDDVDMVTDVGTIVSGQGLLARGTVLGKITASGKLAICDKAASGTGCNVPFAVLANETDATSADKTATVYIMGAFNASSLIFAAGTVVADVKDLARDKNMYFRTTRPAV